MRNGQLGKVGRWIAAIGLGTFLALAPQPARAETNAAPVLAATDTTAPPAAASLEDASHRELRYARREAATPQAAAFKGQGAGIYIGGSTLAVVLVVVLIVVLL